MFIALSTWLRLEDFLHDWSLSRVWCVVQTFNFNVDRWFKNTTFGVSAFEDEGVWNLGLSMPGKHSGYQHRLVYISVVIALGHAYNVEQLYQCCGSDIDSPTETISLNDLKVTYAKAANETGTRWIENILIVGLVTFVFIVLTDLYLKQEYHGENRKWYVIRTMTCSPLISHFTPTKPMWKYIPLAIYGRMTICFYHTSIVFSGIFLTKDLTHKQKF